VYLKLNEFLTDYHAEETIDKGSRTKRGVIRLISGAYVDKGSRASHVVMPIDYSKCGPYTIIEVTATTCIIKLRWNGQHRTIDIPRNSTPYLDIDHSTLRCKLRINDDPSFSKLIHPIFNQPIQITNADVSKKRLRAGSIVETKDGRTIRIRSRSKGPDRIAARSIECATTEPTRKQIKTGARSSDMTRGPDEELEYLLSVENETHAVEAEAHMINATEEAPRDDKVCGLAQAKVPPRYYNASLPAVLTYTHTTPR